MEVLREAPKAGEFVPLMEHQSATPASFYTGPPVLHYHSDRSKVIVLEREVEKVPAFTSFLQHAQPVEQSESNGQANGDSDVQRSLNLEEVDIFVTSDKLLLFSNAASAGVAIPYPTISLHAVQTLPTPSPDLPPGQGVYMQLITSNLENDEEVDSISVTLIPTAAAPPGTTAPPEDDPVENEDKPEQTPVQALFNALSNCSNLHPDPVNEDDEEGEDGSRLIQSGLAIPLGVSDGGLPPPMPGSGGWITAENMHEFIDENGNFIDNDEDVEEQGVEEAAPLGAGAGTVRPRDDGADGEEDEAKWQRTS